MNRSIATLLHCYIAKKRQCNNLTIEQFNPSTKLRASNLTIQQFNNFSPQRGFTIIELLVSITVILLIMGFAFAGYARFNQRQNLISSGQSMKNILRDAQNRAYSGEMDCDSCDCSVTASESLSGWYVDFSSQKIYGECASAVVPNPIITFSPRPFNFNSEIIITPYITPPTTPERLLFRSYPSGVDRSATICLSSADLPSGPFYSIRVSQAGEISDAEEIQDTCPNPE